MKRVVSYWCLAVSVVAAAAGLMKADSGDRAEPAVAQARHQGPSEATARNFGVRFRQVSREKDSTRRDAGSRALAESWVAVNPEEALAFARQLSAGEFRVTFLRKLLEAWAEKDSSAAMAWTDHLDDPAERRSSRSTICIAVAEISPRAALELAVAHGADGEDDGGLLANLTMQWADREPADALEWVEAQPSGEWHDQLMSGVAFVLSKSNPHAAACQVAEGMEPGPMQDEAVISVLHQWAVTDAASAARWAQQFTEGDLRERALGELAGLGCPPANQVE